MSTDAIVIGGSAGGFDALIRILPALPVDFPIPVAVVLHQPPQKGSILAEVVAPYTVLAVKEAEDKEPLVAGTIYLAPANYHLLLERQGTFSLSVDEPVLFSRPAIDVLFESAADALGPALVGVLLSGANDDGARGMLRIAETGGMTIVQTPESSMVPVMPEAALRLTRPQKLLSLGEIGPFLANLRKNP